MNKKMKVIVLCAMSLVVSLSVLMAIFFLYFDGISQANSAREKIVLEVAKLLGQLALIGVAGSIVKFVFDDYLAEREKAEKELEEDRRRRDAQFDRKQGIRRNLRDVFAQVETARDLIEGARSAKTYGQQIRKIMELHFRVGEIRHEITIPADFKGNKEIGEKVKSMENYLGLLIEEYRKEYLHLSNRQTQFEREREHGNSSIDMDAEMNKLPVLQDFRTACEGGNFEKMFRNPYRDARRIIIAEIVNDAGASSISKAHDLAM